MQPIHELIDRIHWDKEFANAKFVIGYYDRVEDRVIRVDLKDITFEPDDHFNMTVTDEELEFHRVPLHRIREVYRNGKLIWWR